MNPRVHALSCRVCAHACSADAIDLSEDEITLHLDRCTACGACLSACPTGALRLEGFSPRRLLEGLSGAAEAHLHCSICTRDASGMRLSCHRLLDARLLAAARAAGTLRVHLHGLTECVHCPKGSAVAHVAEARRRLEEWLGPQHAPQIIAAAPTHGARDIDRCPEDDLRMSRRDWFRHLGVRTVEAGGAWLFPAAQARQPAPSPAELARQRPAEYQAVFAACIAELPWRDVAPPWHVRAILDRCTACLACARFCPTGALRVEEDTCRLAILFDPVVCTDCGLCDRICPADAVAVRQVEHMKELIEPRSTLLERRLLSCQGCGEPFAARDGAERLCSACSDEEVLRASWMTQAAPPGLPRGGGRRPGRERSGLS